LGIRDQAVSGLWHFSHRNRKRNKVSFTVALPIRNDTSGIENGKVDCEREASG
jgi:hypothetical protein